MLLSLKQYFNGYSIDKKFEINDTQFIYLFETILNIKIYLLDNNLFNTFIKKDLEDIFFNELDNDIYKIYSLYYLIIAIINF